MVRAPWDEVDFRLRLIEVEFRCLTHFWCCLFDWEMSLNQSWCIDSKVVTVRFAPSRETAPRHLKDRVESKHTFQRFLKYQMNSNEIWKSCLRAIARVGTCTKHTCLAGIEISCKCLIVFLLIIFNHICILCKILAELASYLNKILLLHVAFAISRDAAQSKMLALCRYRAAQLIVLASTSGIWTSWFANKCCKSLSSGLDSKGICLLNIMYIEVFTPWTEKVQRNIRTCRFSWETNITYCWWTKSCTTKDDDYPIIYRVLTIPGGAGFRPSTVVYSFGFFSGISEASSSSYSKPWSSFSHFPIVFPWVFSHFPVVFPGVFPFSRSFPSVFPNFLLVEKKQKKHPTNCQVFLRDVASIHAMSFMSSGLDLGTSWNLFFRCLGLG